MLGGVYEIFVGAQQHRFVSDAKLSNERIHCTELHARSAACVSKVCCSDVVFAVWLDPDECEETLSDLLVGFRARKTLKKLLQHQPRCSDDS